MCGRYTLTVDPADLMARFDLETADISVTPRYNIAPTQPVAVVFAESPRTLSAARWGLVPGWAKDISIGYKMINARAETLQEKPSFRTLLRKKRCLILADSFYEWQKHPDGSKTPTRLMLADGAPFAFAGLWDVWKTPEGEWMKSCAIITTAPNALAAQVHDRMPAILARETERDWLDRANDHSEHLQSLLTAFPAELMRIYAVSPQVNNVRNDSAALIAPA